MMDEECRASSPTLRTSRQAQPHPCLDVFILTISSSNIRDSLGSLWDVYGQQLIKKYPTPGFGSFDLKVYVYPQNLHFNATIIALMKFTACFK